jgi:hypothetical protein
MIEISVQALAEAVVRRLEEAKSVFSAYWVQVPEGREGYARQLAETLTGEPVAVQVIRDGRFTNANALMSDLVEVLAACREEWEQRLAVGNDGKCGLVLLSRSGLTVPQVASPVVLPAWFPVAGGTEVWTVIEDLTWSADGRLGAQDAKIEDVSECLVGLEDALVARMGRVLEGDRDRRKTMAMLETIGREGETFRDILDAASGHRTRITSTAAFRPSRRGGHTVVARLWGVVLERSPENLTKPSRALAKALDLPDGLDREWHESLCAVLGRPATRDDSREVRFARNIYLTVAASCQLITAAAHSDEYEPYPITLLKAFSYDLRRAMAAAEGMLSALDDA